MARPDRRPLGRPGERPQGFGALAGVPRRPRGRAQGVPSSGKKVPKRSCGPLPASDGRDRSVSATAETPVGHARSGQPQLREGADHEPRPKVGLLWGDHPRGGPPQILLEEAEGVFQVEPAHVRSPEQIEVGLSGAGPPQPQSIRGSRVGRGKRLTSTKTRVPPTMGRGRGVPRAGCSWVFGCNPLQARTRTEP